MERTRPLLVRITTVPMSLRLLLKGQMRYMKEQGYDVMMISSGGKDAESMEELEGCEMITLPMQRSIHPWRDLQSLFRLVRIFRNLQPDIVHTHTPKAGLLGMLAARIAGVPVRLHTVAGLPWMEYKGLAYVVLKQVERLTVERASATAIDAAARGEGMMSLRMDGMSKVLAGHTSLDEVLRVVI